MSKEYDDMLNVQADALKDKKELFIEESKENRNRCYELAEKMTEAVATDGKKYEEYLDIQSRFDRYTPNNVLLIMAQRPDAQRLGDYGYWREQGVYIKRRESHSPILILEPGKEYEREDGSIGTYYNAKKLYDISQTTARERIVTMDKADDRALVRALVNNPPVNIISKEANQIPEKKNALFIPEENCIYVKKGMNVEGIFRSLIPELVHAELSDGSISYDRRASELHAMSVTYMLCNKFGIDTKGISLADSTKTFEKMEPKQVRGELSKMRDVMNTISFRMAKVLDVKRDGENRQQSYPEQRER